MLIPPKEMALAVRRYAADWSWFERLWLITFSLVNLWLYFVWEDTLIGLLASLSGMLTVVLVAKGKVSNYYWGMINVLLYAYLAWQSRYYGEVMLNLLFFFPMQFIGLHLWKKHSTNLGTDVVVSWLGFSRRALWLIVSVAGTAGYGIFLRSLGGRLPFADSASTVLSIIAMILMVQRVAEQWILWISVDVVSIYLWVDVLHDDGRSVSMIVMWSAYLVNAIYGMAHWVLLSRRQQARSAEAG
ncbi:MAG: nicotinamide riboside transporter PnuC [Thermoanaerobaculia bacterium]|nr:nicotinamide riboside transporter PnuC [Thermoanaerobaculia bacterium]